jgi:hypothetical protein
MKRVTPVYLLLLLTAVPAFATGIVEPEPVPVALEDAVGTPVIIRGVISTYGNEPVTFLGILALPSENRDIMVDPDRTHTVSEETLFELTGELLPELRRWQATRVELRGVLEEASRGPGLPARVRVESFTLPDE